MRKSNVRLDEETAALHRQWDREREALAARARDDLAFLETLERQLLTHGLAPDPRFALQKRLVFNRTLGRGGGDSTCLVCAGADPATWAAASVDLGRFSVHCENHGCHFHQVTRRLDPSDACVTCQEYFPEKPLDRNAWLDHQERLLAPVLRPPADPRQPELQLATEPELAGLLSRRLDQIRRERASNARAVRCAEQHVAAQTEKAAAAKKQLEFAQAARDAAELELATARQELLGARELQAATTITPASLLGKRRREQPGRSASQ